MNIYTSYQPPAGGGGLYLKLEEGKSAKLRFVSQPYIFNSEFQGKISTRYAWIVYNYDEKKAQVLQLPITAYRSVANLAQDPDWGEPTGYDIKLTREGSGKETKYHLTPSPNKAPLTAEQQAECEAVDVTKAVKGTILLEKVVAGEPIPVPEAAPHSDLPPVGSYNDVFGDEEPPF